MNVRNILGISGGKDRVTRSQARCDPVWKRGTFIKRCVKMCYVVNILDIILYLCNILVMMAQAV